MSWRPGWFGEERVVTRVLVDSSWVAAASTAMMAIGLVQNLIAARWLGSDGYGLLALVIAYPSFVYLLFDVRAWESLTQYFTRFRSEGRSHDALAVLGFCVLVEVFFGLLSFGAVALSAPWISGRVIRDPDAERLLVLYALSILVTAGEGSFRAVLRVLGGFRQQAAIDIIVAVVRFGFVTAFLSAGHGVRGILIAYVISSFVSLVLRGFQVRRALKAAFGAPLRFRLRDADVPYRRVSALMVETSLSATLKGAADHLGELFLGYFRSPAEVGIFHLGKILLRGVSLVGGSVYEALYPKLVQAVAGGGATVKSIVRASLGLLLVTGVPIGLTLFALAPIFALLLGGAGFDGAADVLRIAIWGDLLILLSVWTHPLAVALGRAKVANLAWLLASVVWIVGSLVAVPEWGYLASAVLHLISRVVVAAVYVIALRDVLGWTSLVRRATSADSGVRA